MKIHPAADIFPAMDDATFAGFKEDIRAHGLREPILVDQQGRILDGRNRARACQEIGMPLRTIQWDGNGSAVERVISLNLHRRHLTTQQREQIAVDVLALFEKEARERQKTARPGVRGGIASGKSATSDDAGFDYGENQKLGRARDKAAAALNVSGRGVSNAKRLRKHAPDKAAAVKAGTATMRDAEREATEQKRAEITLPFVNDKWQYFHLVEADHHLQTFPDVEQAEIKGMLARFNDYSALPPKPVLDMLRNLKTKAVKDRARIYELSKAHEQSDAFDLALTECANRPPMPDRRIQMLRDSARDLQKIAAVKDDDLSKAVLDLAARASQLADQLKGRKSAA